MNRPLTRTDIVPDIRARFSASEFERMAQAGAFDDMKVELVYGELERVNFPKSRHSIRQSSLLLGLTRALQGTSLVATAEIGIDLGNDTVRGCDVAVLSILPDDDRWMRPDEMLLVIEVAETTIKRDLGPKRADYAAGGITNYWVVDGDRSIVHLYADPVGGEYTCVHTVKFGDAIPVPGTDQAIVVA